MVASNKGFTFRGNPREIADDVLVHILNKSTYTTDVVFQTVCPFPYGQIVS